MTEGDGHGPDQPPPGQQRPGQQGPGQQGPDERAVGHGGTLAVAAARAHGVTTMFTLSGGHVFPLYDAAVHADPPMRLLDVRHEQTAVFAAEAIARLTRLPGLAVLTAGPGGMRSRHLRRTPARPRRGACVTYVTLLTSMVR